MLVRLSICLFLTALFTCQQFSSSPRCNLNNLPSLQFIGSQEDSNHAAWLGSTRQEQAGCPSIRNVVDVLQKRNPAEETLLSVLNSPHVTK